MTIDIAMKVSTLAEEVTVSGESPVVDTKSASVTVNLDTMLLETTPGGKDIWNILEYKVPGVDRSTRPTSAATRRGLQRAFTSRGTPNAQNMQLLNGVNVGDPAAIGLLDELLRAEHVREHPGHDRRAGHLDRHLRRR